MKRSVRTLLMMLTVVGALFAASEARADYWGYPCGVTADFGPYAYYGQYGMGQVSLYSQPRCAGSYVGYVNLYTTGATANVTVKLDQMAFWTQLRLFQENAIHNTWHQAQV